MTAGEDGISGQLAEAQRAARIWQTLNACISIGLLLCGGALWLGRSLHLPTLVAVAEELCAFPMAFALAFFAATLILLVRALIGARSGQALPLLKRVPLVLVLPLVNFICALAFLGKF